MHQIYALSIITLLLAGIAVSIDGIASRLRLDSIFNVNGLEQPAFRVVLGGITFIVGFLKLLSPAPGDLLIIGDLLPALSGMSLGVILLLLYYRDRSNVSTTFIDSLDRVFIRNKNLFGGAGMAVALVHFFLQRVTLL